MFLNPFDRDEFEGSIYEKMTETKQFGLDQY